MKKESVEAKRYQNIEIVGNGTFGCVYLVKYMSKKRQKTCRRTDKKWQSSTYTKTKNTKTGNSKS